MANSRSNGVTPMENKEQECPHWWDQLSGEGRLRAGTQGSKLVTEQSVHSTKQILPWPVHGKSVVSTGVEEENEKSNNVPSPVLSGGSRGSMVVRVAFQIPAKRS